MKALALCSAVLATLVANAFAASADEGSSTIVYGDGWAFVVAIPAGWEFDCCNRAPRHDSALLVFPHGWNGADPDRVMSLRVWNSNHASVDADWEADAKAYRERFPDVQTEKFAAAKNGLHCRSAVYAGSDHARDYVVFCDPGNDLGFHFSWSMLLRDNSSDIAQSEKALRSVIEATQPMSASIQKK
jgi:hypothetical protein